jgi:hypothetical protein
MRFVVATWEYARISYVQEGSMSRPGAMIWTAQIAWPGSDHLDIRDEVRIEDVLTDAGRRAGSSWESFQALGSTLTTTS